MVLAARRPGSVRAAVYGSKRPPALAQRSQPTPLRTGWSNASLIDHLAKAADTFLSMSMNAEASIISISQNDSKMQ